MSVLVQRRWWPGDSALSVFIVARVSLDGAGSGVDDPGELPRALPPGGVATADAAVTSVHLRLEQQRSIAGGRGAEPRHPLGGLDEQHACVVQAGDGED